MLKNAKNYERVIKITTNFDPNLQISVLYLPQFVLKGYHIV